MNGKTRIFSANKSFWSLWKLRTKDVWHTSCWFFFASPVVQRKKKREKHSSRKRVFNVFFLFHSIWGRISSFFFFFFFILVNRGKNWINFYILRRKKICLLIFSISFLESIELYWWLIQCVFSFAFIMKNDNKW